MIDDATIQDTAVAVRMAVLGEKMDGVQKSNVALAEQLRTLSDQVGQLNGLHHQQASNDESIKRLWSEIAARDAKWDARLAATDSVASQNRDRINQVLYAAGGMASVAMLLVGLLIYLGKDEVERTRAIQQRLDERLDRVEIHLAGPRTAPYSR